MDPLCRVKKSISSKVNLSKISFIKGQLKSVIAKNNSWLRKQKVCPRRDEREIDFEPCKKLEVEA